MKANKIILEVLTSVEQNGLLNMTCTYYHAKLNDCYKDENMSNGLEEYKH
jgi:hypothetical protein